MIARTPKTTSILCMLGGIALAMTTGCGHNALHASYGQRHALVMAAQTNAHPTREPITRGDEAARLMRKYYYILQGGSMMMMGGAGMGGMSGGMSGSMGGGSMGGMSSMGSATAGQYGTGSTANLSTAGVAPLR